MHASERARVLAHQRLRKLASGEDAEHTPDRTLVIVDMQDHFLSCSTAYTRPPVGSTPGPYGHYSEMVDRMCNLIIHAKANEWGIILVEICGIGPTTKAIRQAVTGYEHLETVVKDQEDGGPEIVSCLRNHPKWSPNILVCGIFGNACVPATVRGIFKHNNLARVDVITDMVYPEYVSSSEEAKPPEREIGLDSLGLPKKLAV